MGRKLTANEIEFLFRCSFFIEHGFGKDFLALLIEHFCDCADKTESLNSACLAANTVEG